MYKGSENRMPSNNRNQEGWFVYLVQYTRSPLLLSIRSGDANLWHQRLGHPQGSVVPLLQKKRLINVIGSLKTTRLCDSCQLGKLSKLPFASSEHSSLDIFDKIHCDLWGPAPVLSLGKFKFYACLVDDFSKYTWLIPLRHKYEFFTAYLAFEKYADKQFNKKIKISHSDGGGEFVNSKLSAHFLATGTLHQISCPYTPEQTGMVERRHRIICELGMTMLFHCNAPLYLWMEAFTTVVFLITDCLPLLSNLKLHFSCCIKNNLIIHLFMCLAQNVFHIHGVPRTINLTQKLFCVFL